MYQEGGLPRQPAFLRIKDPIYVARTPLQL